MDFSNIQLYIYIQKSDIRNQTGYYFKMNQNERIYSFNGNYENSLDDFLNIVNIILLLLKMMIWKKDSLG